MLSQDKLVVILSLVVVVCEVNRWSVPDNFLVVLLVEPLAHVQLIAAQRKESRFHPVCRLDRVQFEQLHKVDIPKTTKAKKGVSMRMIGTY